LGFSFIFHEHFTNKYTILMAFTEMWFNKNVVKMRVSGHLITGDYNDGLLWEQGVPGSNPGTPT